MLPEKVAIGPSMKFEGVADDATRTLCPTANAVAVAPRLVVKTFDPEPTDTDDVLVRPAYPSPVGPVAPVVPVGPVAPVAPAAPVTPVAPAGPVDPVTPVAPVAPTCPAVEMFQSASVPEPPIRSTLTVRAVPENAVMTPSMKLAVFAADSARTRCPTTKALAVDARFVVKAFEPVAIRRDVVLERPE